MINDELNAGYKKNIFYDKLINLETKDVLLERRKTHRSCFLRSADLKTASDAFGDYVPSRKELLSQHTLSFSTVVNLKKGHYYHKTILLRLYTYV